MNDHAPRVKHLEEVQRDEKEIGELGHASAPLFYTVAILLVLTVCAGIDEYHRVKKENEHLSNLLSMAANQRMTPLGQDAVLECKRTELVAGLK